MRCFHMLSRAWLALLPLAVIALLLHLDARSTSPPKPGALPPSMVARGTTDSHDAGCTVCTAAARLGLRAVPWREVKRYRCVRGDRILWPRGPTTAEGAQVLVLGCANGSPGLGLDGTGVWIGLWREATCIAEGVTTPEAWEQAHEASYASAPEGSLGPEETDAYGTYRPLRAGYDVLRCMRVRLPPEVRAAIERHAGHPEMLQLELRRPTFARSQRTVIDRDKPSRRSPMRTRFRVREPTAWGRRSGGTSRVDSQKGALWLDDLLAGLAAFEEGRFGEAHEAAWDALLAEPDEPHAVALLYGSLHCAGHGLWSNARGVGTLIARIRAARALRGQRCGLETNPPLEQRTPRLMGGC